MEAFPGVKSSYQAPLYVKAINVHHTLTNLLNPLPNRITWLLERALFDGGASRQREFRLMSVHAWLVTKKSAQFSLRRCPNLLQSTFE